MGRHSGPPRSDLTSQMLDSIHGSADGPARIPMSDRLRALGRTPSTANKERWAARADAVSRQMGTTGTELFLARRADSTFAAKPAGNSPSRTKPSRSEEHTSEIQS